MPVSITLQHHLRIVQGDDVDYLAGYCIFSSLNELRDLKLSWKTAVLTISHRMAIDPQIEGIVDAIKLKKNPTQGISVSKVEVSRTQNRVCCQGSITDVLLTLLMSLTSSQSDALQRCQYACISILCKS